MAYKSEVGAASRRNKEKGETMPKETNPQLAEELKAMRAEMSAFKKLVTALGLLPPEVRTRILSKLIDYFDTSNKKE